MKPGAPAGLALWPIGKAIVPTYPARVRDRYFRSSAPTMLE